MDETLRQLIRQARQQDDPEKNVRVAQALDRAGELTQIMHDIDHQPVYLITIRIRSWFLGYDRDVDMEVQPMSFNSLVLRPKKNGPYHVWPWTSPQPNDAQYVFTLFLSKDAEKSPFDAIDLAGMIHRWGDQREIFWLPLKSKKEEDFRTDAIPTATLPQISIGGPAAPAIYVADNRDWRILRDISDSIERWVDDHPSEMQAANQQWNLFQVALQTATYKGVLERLREEEIRLSQRISDWIHNRWD